MAFHRVGGDIFIAPLRAVVGGEGIYEIKIKEIRSGGGVDMGWISSREAFLQPAVVLTLEVRTMSLWDHMTV